MENRKLYKIVINANPMDTDIAITAVDVASNIRPLNDLVFKLYGYNEFLYDDINLKENFSLHYDQNKKPIIIIDTFYNNSMKGFLDNAIYNCLIKFDEIIKGKKVWISLMGTGVGGLTLIESYNIIVNALKNIEKKFPKNNSEFIISVPNDQIGLEFIEQIKTLENNRLSVKAGMLAKLLKKYTSRLYIVRTINSNDQLARFYKEKIWEADENIANVRYIINSIAVGDIIINRSISKSGPRSFSILRAVGIVTANQKNGFSLSVNWILSEINKTMIGSKFSNSLVVKSNDQDVVEILSLLENQDLQKLLNHFNNTNNNLLNIKAFANYNKSTKSIAGLVSDSDIGDDYLEISKDIAAFSRVITAKSFEPPLAIALLGKWGSGKSFFMNKLKESIQILSKENPENAFCEGIAHVHFNAWSYMDANLWASIVTRIFEGLQEYISSDNLAKRNKKEIEEKLTKNLSIAKEEIGILEKQNKNIKIQIEKLTKAKELAEIGLKAKIDSIKLKTIRKVLLKVDENFNVQEKIQDALDENPTFIQSVEKLKEIIPEKYWISPNEIYHQLNSKYTFLKIFFSKSLWIRNTLWLVAILAIIYFTPIFTYITTLLISWQNFTLSFEVLSLLAIVGTIWKRAIDTYKELQPLIASFWKIKEDHKQEKENAIFKFQQREKGILLEIENNKSQINSITEQINKASIIESSIEFKLQNALSTEALFTFIEKRANSEDYKKHLGIVSIIRKDFEILNDLLIEHKQEANKNKESREFKTLFDKPLERIILYIDDLDRCSEEQVVEVLEAVNLLMAFPLFVVVVGVDPRWVKNALIKKHSLQFQQDDSHRFEYIEPSSYLEKIFQIPFHLKDAEDTSIKYMIKTLAQVKPDLSKFTKAKDIDTNTMSKQELEYNNIDFSNSEAEADYENSLSGILFDENSIKALNISDRECDLLQGMSEIIGNNPRAVKRFINIYRIVKTHEDFHFDEKTHENELLITMFLIAMPMGIFKSLKKDLDIFITSANDSLTDKFIFFESSSNFDKELNMNLLSKLKLIINNSHPDLKNQNITLFKKHHNFLNRFTFNKI